MICFSIWIEKIIQYANDTSFYEIGFIDLLIGLIDTYAQIIFTSLHKQRLCETFM